MKFEEALILLKEGKNIRRKEWLDGTYFRYSEYCFLYYYPIPFNGRTIENMIETIYMDQLLADD